MKRVVVVMLSLSFLIGCLGNSETQSLVSGIDATAMDKSVRPQDNLYDHVNGTWMAETEMPGDRTSIGAFYNLREKAREDVLDIIKELADQTDHAPGSDEQKVADLYNSYMNTEHLEALGLTPLDAQLAAIDAIADKDELAAYFGISQTMGAGTPLATFVSIDAKDATQYAVLSWQTGLGLPDRDYYFNEDEQFSSLRTAYVEHVQKMFELAGFDAPQASAEMLMALETRIAEGHWTNVENRDSEATYNKVAVDELPTLAPGFNWGRYLATRDFGNQSHIIISQPTYLTHLAQVVAETSLDDWKTYARWNLLNNNASLLTAALDNQNFEFYDKTLSGQLEQRPRWKRGVDTVSGTLGEVIGRVYVARHFKPEAKARMVELVDNLGAAYGDGIETLEWMSPETKKAAKVKLEKFTSKIGYPDRWKDYADLEIKADDLMGNVLRNRRFGHQDNVSKLGQPIRKWEWGMTPQTVNAYYNPLQNEVVFPAAILQPPFFNMAADDAVNYGAIGAVIGHEMGHGFDDQGSRFDGDGNMRNWWNEQDAEEFAKRTSKLVDQYAGFEVFDGLFINGELTLGENIGDLAGCTIAYRAYKRALNGKPSPVIDGYTGEQRFFMGWAQVWRSKYTEMEMRNRVATDPHSPAQFRAIGTVANMPEFHAAFDVTESDGMYLAPEDRVKIW